MERGSAPPATIYDVVLSHRGLECAPWGGYLALSPRRAGYDIWWFRRRVPLVLVLCAAMSVGLPVSRAALRQKVGVILASNRLNQSPTGGTERAVGGARHPPR